MPSTGSASHLARVAFRRLARSLALLALVPAILFNIDWAGGADWQTVSVAVAMIVGSALIIDVAFRQPHWARTPVLLLVALFLVYGNTKAAIRSLSLASEGASEAREARILAGSQLAAQRSRLEARRAAQSKIAGEDAVATLETAIEAL